MNQQTSARLDCSVGTADAGTCAHKQAGSGEGQRVGGGVAEAAAGGRAGHALLRCRAPLVRTAVHLNEVLLGLLRPVVQDPVHLGRAAGILLWLLGRSRRR